MKISKYILCIAAMMLLGCKNETGKGTGAQKEKAGQQNAAAAVDEKVLLRLNTVKGDELAVVYEMKTKGTDVRISENITMTMKVLDTLKGNITYSGSVTSMKYDSTTFGQKDYYDSTKKESEMTPGELEWHNDLKHVINNPAKFTLSKKGEIIKTFDYGTGGAGDMKLDEPISLSNFQVVFPDKEVGIGDAWESEYKVWATGSIAKRTYKLVAILQDRVVINAKSSIPGIKGLTGESTLDGEYTIDKRTGRLIAGRVQGHLSQRSAFVTFTFKTTQKHN